MQIAILIFDELTALDADRPLRGPLAPARRGARSSSPSEAGPKRTDTGALGLIADLAIAEVDDPDVLLVPGGEGNRPMLDRRRGARLGARRARRQRPGRRRSAPARWSSAPRGSSTASAPPRTGRYLDRLSRARRRGRRPSGWSRTARSSRPPGSRRESTWPSRWSREIAGAGRGPGDPARDRVRPGAALRLGLARQGGPRAWSSSSATWRARPPRTERWAGATFGWHERRGGSLFQVHGRGSRGRRCSRPASRWPGSGSGRRSRAGPRRARRRSRPWSPGAWPPTALSPS